MSEIKGYVHSFESLAALDGDGLRFAVFLSGCPLNCVYCHNPDTRYATGSEITPIELARKAMRYKPYFKNGGGVTFSGGEPLAQAGFVSRSGKLLAEYGISYALDTSGAVSLSESVKDCVDNAELIILDLKFWDEPSYKNYCGGSLNPVIEFGNYVKASGKRFWLRTVIVPGINDTVSHIEKYALLAKSLGGFEKYELLAFHTMGFDKYEKLGIENPLAGFKDLDKDRLDELQKYLDKLTEDNDKAK